MLRTTLLTIVFSALALSACGGDSDAPAATQASTQPPAATATPTAGSEPTPEPTATPTEEPAPDGWAQAELCALPTDAQVEAALGAEMLFRDTAGSDKSPRCIYGGRGGFQIYVDQLPTIRPSFEGLEGGRLFQELRNFLDNEGFQHETVAGIGEFAAQVTTGGPGIRTGAILVVSRNKILQISPEGTVSANPDPAAAILAFARSIGDQLKD